MIHLKQFVFLLSILFPSRVFVLLRKASWKVPGSELVGGPSVGRWPHPCALTGQPRLAGEAGGRGCWLVLWAGLQARGSVVGRRRPGAAPESRSCRPRCEAPSLPHLCPIPAFLGRPFPTPALAEHLSSRPGPWHTGTRPQAALIGGPHPEDKGRTPHTVERRSRGPLRTGAAARGPRPVLGACTCGDPEPLAGQARPR